MSIVFMGTPEFAVESLKTLVGAGENIAAVFTKPDKPKGRGMQTAFSAVKEYAITQDITVYQPETLKDDSVFEAVAALKPEFIVVVAYGLFLPKRYLELPSIACVNVHGSLLPKYRGAAPIQWAVLNGDSETGVCTMHMAKGMDTGDVILSKAVPIEDDDTFGTVHDKLKTLGAEALIETLPMLRNGTAPRIVQDEELVTLAPPITKEFCELDLNDTVVKNYNKIRGLQPFPCAAFRGFKIHAANLEGGSGIRVQCADGALFFTEIQAPGKRKMTAEEYLRGRKNIGDGIPDVPFLS